MSAVQQVSSAETTALRRAISRPLLFDDVTLAVLCLGANKCYTSIILIVKIINTTLK